MLDLKTKSKHIMTSYSNLLLTQNYRLLSGNWEEGIKVHVSGLGDIKERKYN